VGQHRSFVMADIPGLIEGAAEGAGLGHRFLKHLQRTRVLLHLIDIAPLDPAADPVQDARAIASELKKYSADLAAKPRWLVLNKMDLLPADEARAKAVSIARKLRHTGPAFIISGATGEGTRELSLAVMQLIEGIAAGKDVSGIRGTLEVPAPVARKAPVAKAARKSSKPAKSARPTKASARSKGAAGRKVVAAKKAAPRKKAKARGKARR
jgi:GTP-binding protein